jgi:branched-chain amino acid aminotransferase
MESCGKFFYLDGNIMPADNDEVVTTGDVTFYEVIRTREGIPLFFNDHMKRLRNGISTRYDLDHDIAEKVREGLDALVLRESFPEVNVRVTVAFTGQEYSLRIFYIPSSYPDQEMISRGVRLLLYHAVRFDPGVKILNNKLRMSVNEALSRKGAYEALLVNSEGYITEGSRSNVFFVTDEGTIHTASDEIVLQGITREYVIQIIRQEGFGLVLEPVRETDIRHFRSVFITGTSPMVLPVLSIEDHMFEVNNTVTERLRQAYASLVSESIRNYKLKKSKD